MKIVVRNSDAAVVMVACVANPGYDSAAYTTYNVPGWDWSKANLAGVAVPPPPGQTLLGQLMWNGTTLVKK